MVIQREARAEENVESSSIGDGMEPPRNKFAELYDKGMKKILRQ